MTFAHFRKEFFQFLTLVKLCFPSCCNTKLPLCVTLSSIRGSCRLRAALPPLPVPQEEARCWLYARFCLWGRFLPCLFLSGLLRRKRQSATPFIHFKKRACCQGLKRSAGAPLTSFSFWSKLSYLRKLVLQGFAQCPHKGGFRQPPFSIAAVRSSRYTKTSAECALPAWAPLRQLAAKKALLFSPAPFMATACLRASSASAPAHAVGLAFPPRRPSLAPAVGFRLSARASQALSAPLPAAPARAVSAPSASLQRGHLRACGLAQIAFAVPFGSTPASVRPRGSPLRQPCSPASAPCRGALAGKPFGSARSAVGVSRPPALKGSCRLRAALSHKPRNNAGNIRLI